MTDDFISIDNRKIGLSYPPYIIAELSANHNGSIDRALALLEAAKEAGADAVKLQTYTADTLTIDCHKPEFCIEGGPWHGRTLYDLYNEGHMPWEWQERLFERAQKIGITLFSSPFDDTSVDFLEKLGTPAYKIASFEAVDLNLIKRVAATGKPVIISTGIANIEEIGEAVDAARTAGCEQLMLLHCVSGYPTPPADANLNTIPDLRRQFDTIIGLSDHTTSTATAVASIALGAAAIEKHFTLDRMDGGLDAEFSLEPEELSALVRDVRSAWEALGSVNYVLKKSEENNLMFRRSLYAVESIAAGEKFTKTNIRSIRPGYGLPPKYLDDIIGRRTLCNIEKGTALTWDLLDY